MMKKRLDKPNPIRAGGSPMILEGRWARCGSAASRARPLAASSASHARTLPTARSSRLSPGVLKNRQVGTSAKIRRLIAGRTNSRSR